MSAEPEFQSRPFNYDADDLRALAGQVRPQWYRRLRVAAIVLMALMALTVFFEIAMIPAQFDWAPIACGMIASILLLLFANARVRSWIALQLIRRGAFYAPHSFALLPGGLYMESPKARSEIPWTAIVDLKRTPDRVFFFVTKRLAYVVPRRAFDDDSTFISFASAAEERWRSR